MADSPLKDLRAVLSEAPTLSAFNRAWEENQAFLSLLKDNLPGGLVGLIRQVRRTDPAKGIRGSQLTIITANAAAASKIRMLSGDWPAQFAARGIGIQSIKVIAERAMSIDRSQKSHVPRQPIPASVRIKLKELSLSCPAGPLGEALKKLAR